MVTPRRRLEILEERIRPRSSPDANRSPEEVAERERQFQELFRELGMAKPEARDPPAGDPRQNAEELFAEIERCRANNGGKEQR